MTFLFRVVNGVLQRGSGSAGLAGAVNAHCWRASPPRVGRWGTARKGSRGGRGAPPAEDVA